MATINFLYRSSRQEAFLNMRLLFRYQNKDYNYAAKTKILTEKNYWVKNHFVKSRDVSIKNMQIDLNASMMKLESFVLGKFEEIDSRKVNKEWLEFIIESYYNKDKPSASNFLVDYADSLIKDLPYRVNIKGEKGVSESTVKKYRTIRNKLEGFERFSKTKFSVSDVNLDFRTNIIKYLKENDRLGDNSIGRYLKVVKSICLDAQKKGIEVSEQLLHFKGFTVKAPIVVLSFEELAIINRTTFINENHVIAKDWLIIGSYVGQRVSDLLRMKKSFIQRINNFEFIVIEQKKTGKIVQIPLHAEVKKIMDKRNGEFPPTFANNADSSSTLFRRYLKELCEIAKINTIVEGNYYDKKTKRTIRGKVEKYRLISSHVCRRSFATNFYAKRNYPTPLLMNITGHTTEKMFLEYIGKQPIDYSMQLAEIWSKEALKGSDESFLTVVKSSVS